MLQLQQEGTPIIKLHKNGNVTKDDDSASIVHRVKKLAKDTKNLKKVFTQLQKTGKRESDLSL
jgi:hypothetical protein